MIIIIPARGGSKGIPNKNLRELNHKPLVSYSIESACFIRQMSNDTCQVILTSDSEEILSVSDKFVGITKIKRPDTLANDTALTIDVVLHVLELIKDKKEDEIVLLLQPTVPFRPEHELLSLINTIDCIKSGEFNSLVSLKSVDSYHPFRFKRVLEDNRCISYIDQGFEDMRPRQLLPDCYIRSGSYYLSTVSTIINKKSLVNEPVYGFIHSGIEPINIDNTNDLYLANLQMTENG